MSLLSVGVFGTSSKENEKRVPIHPDQIEWIDEQVREKLTFEQGYGHHFGIDDEQIAAQVGGMAPREDLFRNCDVLLLPKPVQADFDAMPEGAILWGWPHCVQQQSFTQTAIDQKLTLIAWEAMHRWSKHGDWQMHIFHKNNELAGYAGVLHAFGLAGINGSYGPQRKAVVISFGSVSRGAIHALRGLGVFDITVFTQRYSTLVADQIIGIEHRTYEEGDDGQILAYREDGQTQYDLIDELATADIIVNGTLQDTDRPQMFVRVGEIDRLKPGCLIIDVSCDEGMGFYFARPTSFADPMFRVGLALYYAVDHTPSYLWNSASWEISNSLLPYLPIIMGGPKRWMKSETVKRAIEIREGVVQNPKILSFQEREEEYPHAVRE